MRENHKLPLQLFADEAGQETGVDTADAGQSGGDGSTGTEQGRMSWQEIMADPEYKKQFDTQVQGIVQKRLRGQKGAEESLRRLSPVLSALSRRYGGEGTELEAMDMDELAGNIARGESAAQTKAKRERIASHLERLLVEEAELRKSFPDFELVSAMEDPGFIRLTAPHTGLSLEQAYYALHQREIGEATAKSSLEAVTRAVSSGGARPREHSGKQSASTLAYDPRTMSKAEREALRQRIYEAKAQGKKLPFGA